MKVFEISVVYFFHIVETTNVHASPSEKPVLRILKNLKPYYKNERYLIKDKNGKIIQKSENLSLLINRSNIGKIKLIK